MSDEETTIETKGLDKLIKLLGVTPPVARVGVLGDSAARAAGSSNAQVGAAHEYGTSKLPQRSFLRIPIAEHLEKRMESTGAFDEDTFRNTLASGTLLPYMRKVGALAKAIVLEAFATGGFGKWRPSNMDQKKNKQTLVETQQLRNSITYDVKDTG